MNYTEYRAQQDAIDQEYRKRAPEDYMVFVRGLMIPTSDGAQLLDHVLADYQMDCFRRMAPNIHALRDGDRPMERRYWIERTKGAGKDSDLATILLWLLAFPRRPIYLQVGAADRDQAAIIRRRMVDLISYNPWLGEFVDVQRYKAVNRLNPIAELDILAADIAGSQGDAPDLLIVNELTQVLKWEFIENLLDNADKVARGMVVIATNAGFKGSKAERLRKNAEENPRKWKMLLWQKPAPWVSEDDLKDARKRNLLSRYNRLWWGRWASGKGDALAEDDIDICLSKYHGPLESPEKGWQYVAGLDLGISHDHCGLVVLGINRLAQKIRICRIHAWEPSIPNDRGVKEVDSQLVEDACYKVHKTFRIRWFGYDPAAGGSFMAQRLRRRGVPMRELSFSSPTNLKNMATSLVQCMTSRTLEGFDDEDGRLRRDFGKFNILEKPSYYRLEAVSDEFGHADVGTALVICLFRAVEYMEGVGMLEEDDELIDGSEKELTDAEIDKLPDALKDIYDVSGEPSRPGGWDDRDF